MSAIQLPDTNCRAVSFSKNATIRRLCSSSASTRGSSYWSPNACLRYVRGPSTSSTIPSACESGFSGAHIQPPDHAVAPPSTEAFSATTTSSP